MRKTFSLLGAPLGAAVLAAGLIAMSAGRADATPCGLDADDRCDVSNGNATIGYDPIDNAPGDQQLSGFELWTIGGVSQLFQQVYAIRIGGDAGSTNTINIGALPLTSADFDDTTDEITVSYFTGGGDDLVTVDLRLKLRAGPDVISAIDVSVDIAAGANLIGTPISFFMYTDLDLAGTSGDDSATSSADTLTQRDGATTVRVRTSTPTSGFQTANDFPTLFNAIEGGTLGGSVVLNNASGPLTGDINHVFQWTYTPDQQNLGLAIRVTTEAIPAPAMLGLLGLGLVGLGLARRKAA